MCLLCGGGQVRGHCHSCESRLSSFAWVGRPTSAYLPQCISVSRVYAAQRNPPLGSNNQGAIIFILCDAAGIYNKRQGHSIERPCLGSALFGLSDDRFADHEPGYDHLLDLWRAIAQQVAHDIPQPHRNGMFGAIAWMPDYYHHILYALHRDLNA